MHFPDYALLFRLTNARAQFSYSPLVWMFHSRKLNKKINDQHYRALRMVHRDETSSFNELLAKDGFATIHHRNLQFLAIEMYKVFNGIAPAFMSNIFRKHLNADTENIFANTRSVPRFYNHHNPNTVNMVLRHLGQLARKFGV